MGGLWVWLEVDLAGTLLQANFIVCCMEVDGGTICLLKIEPRSTEA